MRIPAPHELTDLAGKIPFAMTSGRPDIVRVYEAGRFHDKPVKVEPATLRNMNEALKIVWDIKLNDMPYGSLNQYHDIFRTQGESFLRGTALCLKQIDRGNMFVNPQWKRHARYGVEYQAGLCAEHATLALDKLRRLNLPDPIGIANARTKSGHAFPVIGDPRDRRYGTRNTVVLDSWTVYPTVTTLDQSKYGYASFTVAPFVNTEPPEDYADLPNHPIDTTAEVAEVRRTRGYSPPGDQLVRRILREEKVRLELGGAPLVGGPAFFNQLFGAHKPDKRFVSSDNPMGRRFNDVPTHYWNEVQQTAATIRRDYSNEMRGLPYSPSGTDIEMRSGWTSTLTQLLSRKN
jgi:hypothetical protein